jgi:hypothetical protein
MASANTRFLVAYSVLVGLPLLSLAGVLKTGRRLDAPISVNGAWSVELKDQPPDSQSCANAVGSLAHTGMAIAQSGKHFVLDLGEDLGSSSGTINGQDLRSEMARSQKVEGSCGNGGAVSLAATLESKTANVMEGTISFSDCASCSPVKFRATRRDSASRKETR